MPPVLEEGACFSRQREADTVWPWPGPLIPAPGISFLRKSAPQLGGVVKVTFQSWLQKSEKQVFKRFLRNSRLQWIASDAGVRI